MPLPDAISRRRFLELASAGAATAVLAGCQGGSSTKSTSASGAVVAAGPPGPGSVSGGAYGGTVHVAFEGPANSLDAALGWNPMGWDALTSLLYMPLYRFAGQNGAAAPALASGMPVITNGGKTYTVKLQPSARFSTGRAIVAEDYVYSWSRVLDPKLASWASSYLLVIAGATEVMSGKAKTLSGVRALDAHTLEIHLESPTFTFLNYLAQPYMAAVPREVVEARGAAFATNPVGQGPFKMDSYSSASETATYSKNPYFFWKGLPYVSQVQHHWGVNAQLALLQLKQGATQILGDGIGPSLAAQVQNDASLKKYTYPVGLNAVQWIQLNCASGPLADPRVRAALNWATNRDQLALATHGLWIPWGYPLPKNLNSYTRVAQSFGYDVERAKSLLGDAGVSSLQLTVLTKGNDPWPDVLQVLQQQWKAVGVNLVISSLSTAAYNTSAFGVPLRVDSYQDDWYMAQTSALDIIVPQYTSSGSYNNFGYKNPTVDKLSQQAQAQTSLAASNVYVAKIEEELVADPPSVFMFNSNFVAGRSPSVHNYQYRGETGSYYDRMWV